MPEALIIGLDNGTQGTKCAVYSLDRRRILAQAYAPHGLIENDRGGREQEPAWWVEAAEQTLGECLAQEGVDPAAVVAIGVSGQQHGCVPLDAEGRVIRPAKLWCDTETAPECAAITEAMGGQAAVIRAIGNAIAAGFTASKVRWLKDHEPEHYRRLAMVLLPHDYLNHWLTGAYRTECGDASGTAYFDVRRRCWSEAALRAIDPGGKLLECVPEIVAADEPAGRLRPELAARFGLSPEVLVSAGGGDNMMAAIGTGNVVPGVVTASLGTSGTIYACADRPVIDRRGEVAAFCSSSGAWLPLVCTMNVTVATELTRKLFDQDVKTFDGWVEQSPAGAEGLLLLPYFNGERTPAYPTAKASLTGLTSTNMTQINVCRAAMEGATFGLRYGLAALNRRGVVPAEIRLVGGGAKSGIWRRIVANVLDCPVVCPACTEAGAMGAVLQALWCWRTQQGEATALSAIAAEHIALDERTRTLPVPAERDRYHEVFERYLAFDRALRPLWR